MLRIDITNRFKPPVFAVGYSPGTWYPPKYSTPGQDSTAWQEANRRDLIIKQLASTCPFYKGQVLIPVMEHDREAYGDCVVYGVCTSYAEYGKDVEWPKNDVPLLITAISDKTKQAMFAPVSFFKAKGSA